MLFNSIDFAIFLPIVFVFYWFVTNKNLKLQNLLIVVASYIFYGWWDWRFLGLIVFSTILDFIVGLKLENEANQAKRKALLWISIIVNLGFLGFFKYFNFFLNNFATAFTLFGFEIKANRLNIILPVGISFYTFQTLSYTIDIYNRKLKPTTDFIAYSAFVSFFPQLVAGPIERAANLLSQFFDKRNFDYLQAVNGLRQILWGLFKKVVIADNCAEFVNVIFKNSAHYSGTTLLLGAFFLTFQFYCDFSGYSDIAIGTAKLFGINLNRNFAFPFFSRDIAEFWRRWHISLTSWFRDYLYIPLGGSRGSSLKTIRNTFIIFIISGFWHGANWTFIIWGMLNAFYILPLLITKKNRTNLEIVAKGKYLPTLKETFSMLVTFSLTVFACIVFRAENVKHALQYIKQLFKSTDSLLLFHNNWESNRLLLMIGILIIFEWLGRENQFALDKIHLPRFMRWCIYLLIGLLIFIVGNFNKTEFVYFAF